MNDKIRPYEISIWDDVLVTEGETSYYKEVKIAVIGSDTMTAPSRVINPILHEKVNGETTLSFEIVHRYYDDIANDYVINPFIKYLVNERKIKLHYNDKWYDSIIKSCDEDSENNRFSYETKGLFVNELGRVGYNIELSSDLYNNQGTIFELGEKVVKNTDWVIDREHSDIIQQLVAEPLYIYSNNESFTAIDLTTIEKERVTIGANQTVYFFYSTIANSKTENIQFCLASDYNEKTVLDDNNVARLPNYGFIDETTVSYSEDKSQITIGGVIFTLQTSEDNETGINMGYQGYRLAYNPRTSYDPIKERPVQLYRATYEDGSTQDIYKYTDYEYVTSDIVTSYVSNGSNFNMYNNGSMMGWSNATPSSSTYVNRKFDRIKIGEKLGNYLTTNNLLALFSDLHIDFYNYNTPQEAAEQSEETEEEETVVLIDEATYTYTIHTNNNGTISSIRFEYDWKRDAQDEQLRITIGNNVPIVLTKRSVATFYSIEGLGEITQIESSPVEIETIFESALSEYIYIEIEGQSGSYTLWPLELMTYPSVSGKTAAELTQLNGIQGYMRTEILGTRDATNNLNYLFNDGIGESRDLIKSFSKGEEYVFRIAYGTSVEKDGRPQSDPSKDGLIKAIVAKYRIDQATINSEEGESTSGVYVPDLDNVLFEFTGNFTKKNNVISGGVFQKVNSDYKYYYKDGVSVTPSSDYVYTDGEKELVWDVDSNSFIPLENNKNFLNYYYTTAACKKPISNVELTNTANDYGIFLFTDSDELVSSKEEGGEPLYTFIKEVQLFKKIDDGNEDIVLPGNLPKATAISTDFFYVKPPEGATEDTIETYSTLGALADSLALTEDDIKLVYNENYEKISSIEASQSNCFNIIQDLCESFECWAKFTIDHEPNGAIRLDVNGAPSKRITFHNYVGKDNYAGFKYGINLTSIQRTVDSDEIVTKLIVDQVANDTVEGGTVSIAAAPSNASGNSYILNMSYFLNQGLIEDPADYYKDYNKFITESKRINSEYNISKNKLALAINARTKANKNVTVYQELINEAIKKKADATQQFREMTGMTYESYAKGDGYQISFDYAENSDTLTITYAAVVADIEPSFYNNEGAEILLQEVGSSETIGNLVKKIYQIDSSSTIPITNIAYIGIASKLDGFTITKPKYESYSTAADVFGITGTPAIISQKINYIWAFPIIANSKHLEIYIVPTEENDSLVQLIGEVYVGDETQKQYSPLLEMANTELDSLDLLINGKPTYKVIVSTSDKENYVFTKLNVSDYITGLSLALSSENSYWSLTPSKTEKIFSFDNLYTKIHFKSYPDGYRLQYTSNGTTYYTDMPIALTLPANASKVFSLVPIEENKGLKGEMEALLDEKDAIEKEFYTKYSRFIQEGTWTSDDYIDNELYYLDALNVSNVNSQPKVSYSLAVTEISELEGFENYIFNVGDKTYIEDTQFFGYHYDYINDIYTPIREEVIVSEIEWHLDNAEENEITIQNYKTQFEDLFQRMAAAVQSVEYNSPSYARAVSMLNENGFIDAGLLLKSIQEVGTNLALGDAISFDEEGIVITNLMNPRMKMKLAGSGLKSSVDDGFTWDTLVNQGGVTASTIDTRNVTIRDGDNPSFRWDAFGLNAYGYDNTIDLKTYVRFDKYGLYGVQNGKDFQAKSLQDIKDTAQFGLLWDGFFIKNSYTDGYVSISSDDDFQVVANDTERIKIGALDQYYDGSYRYGIRINNALGETVFTTDDQGDITMTGIVNARGGTFTDSISVGSGEHSIILQGSEDDAVIGSSDYFNDAMKGWAIKANGDAIFNNITARGAIKTAVFEYSEIEAVGGIFMFRPSSTIRTAEIPIIGSVWSYIYAGGTELDPDTTYYIYDEENDTYTEVLNPVVEDLDTYLVVSEDSTTPVYSEDLLLTVENPLLFSIGDWCKVSNYTPEDPQSPLANNGLTNIYQITDISKNILTLQNGAKMFSEILKPTVIDIDTVSGTGANNIYQLSGFTENLTDKYLYDIILEEESETEKDDDVYATGVPKTLVFTNGTSDYPVIYLGNLSLWNNDEELNTGETYLFITLNNQEYLYVGEGNELYSNQSQITFSVYKQRELSYEVDSLVGGALISFANYPDGIEAEPVLSHNYGIGINSSDSAVQLPARAISLFESEVHPDDDTKISYNLRGILGTLPELGNTKANREVYQNMEGTQGIYTDNMYIGDGNQFIAFYEENGKKQLRIKANQIVYEVTDPEPGQDPWQDIADIVAEGVPGEDAIQVIVDSTAGNMFLRKNINTTLICSVYKGTTDITNQVTRFTWTKKDKDGNTDSSWVQPVGTTNSIVIGPSDVASKAIFTCEVEF